MTPPVPAPLGLRRLVWWGGLAALVGVASLALLVSALVVSTSPAVALAIPLALVAVLAAAVWAPRSPAGAFVGVMLLSMGILVNQDGLQLHEVAFALAHVSYLGWWFTSRAFIYDGRIARDRLDLALLVFMAFALSSFWLTVLFGGSLSAAVSEAVSLSLLLLYFPIRELCERSDRGLWICLGVVFAFGAFGCARVLVNFRLSIQDVEYAWEVARGRVTMNELLLFNAATLALALSIVSERWRRFLILGGAFGAYAIALVLTQWRAYYVALALAIGVAFVFAPSAGRRRGALLVVGGGLVAAGVAWLLLGDNLQLVALGLFDRLASIATASSQDPSLINRFLESNSIVTRIWESPILGHGMGVDFGFYDINFRGTWFKTYAHNTYYTLLFKYGAFGLALVLVVWLGTIGTMWRAQRHAGPLDRGAALFVMCSLSALLVSSTVAPVLLNDDTVIAFALLFGIGAGVRARRAALSP